MTDAGVSAFFGVLKVNSSIRELKMEYNYINDKDVSVLADALKVNSFLTSLYLSENRMTDAGASALAGALKVNSSLRELKMEYIEYRNDNAVWLADFKRALIVMVEKGLVKS